jgi:hypothetical protein
VERWAPEYGVTLAPSTRDRYANVHACHVAGYLDDVPLGEFTVALLRWWQAELVKAGVNAGTRGARIAHRPAHASPLRAAGARHAG